MADLIAPKDLPTTTGPFRDANFKLLVINALLRARILDFGRYPKFLKFVEGSQYDYESDGYSLSQKAYDYLARYPLTNEQLASVEALYFDGGLDIYPYVFPFWDGETDEFDIHDLTDALLLPSLKTIKILSMLATMDLSPLEGHPSLEMLFLSCDLDDRAMASVRRLKLRGVNVTVRGS